MEIVKNGKDNALPNNTDIYTMVFGCTTKDEKKALLANISAPIKILLETGEYENVNEGIIDLYTNDDHHTFHTFKQWGKLGYKIIPKSKAFFIWSKPLKGKKKEKGKEENKKKDKEEKDKEFKFYGMAYLFSNAQVELRQPKS